MVPLPVRTNFWFVSTGHFNSHARASAASSGRSLHSSILHTHGRITCSMLIVFYGVDVNHTHIINALNHCKGH